MAREYFCAYHSLMESLTPFGDAECGRLFRAALIYSATGKEEEFRGNERFIWPTIKQMIDKDKKKDPPCGANHWNWQGGKTPENQILRNSGKYHQWRKAVFERDSYTCQLCGKKGKRLNAHHIKPWAYYPDLRFEIANGITFCEACHKKVHRDG